MILHAVEAGEGPPVALLHGLFGAARNFGTLQRRLAAWFRVIALDLRNHGESPHAAEMTYAAMADDVAETLRLRDALPARLMGHSMGGKAAMTLALTAPDAVARLLVADIAPVPYTHSFADLTHVLRALPLTPGLTRAEADERLAAAVPDPVLRGFLLQNLRPGPRPSWRLGLDAIASALPDVQGWRNAPGSTYAGPALFVAGARSDYLIPAYRPAIRTLFPAARFATVKDAGHWLHADNPDGFAGVLEAFFGT